MRFALVLSLFVAGVAAAAPATAADGTPTFTKNVAPIFYKSSIECHRATMFAPMSLTSYEDARPWLRSIKQRVPARSMPPVRFGSKCARATCAHAAFTSGSGSRRWACARATTRQPTANAKTRW